MNATKEKKKLKIIIELSEEKYTEYLGYVYPNAVEKAVVNGFILPKDTVITPNGILNKEKEELQQLKKDCVFLQKDAYEKLLTVLSGKEHDLLVNNTLIKE